MSPRKNREIHKTASNLLVLDNSGSSETTSSSGGDETDLSSVRFISADCGCFTDVLMVTTTVGMLYWVHTHSSHLRPAVTLDLVLVIGSTGLQQRLVNTSTTGNDTYKS